MAGIEGAKITAYRYNAETERYESEGYSYAELDGTYSVKGLRAGTYRLKIEDPQNNFVKEYWDDAADLDSATNIVVAEAATVTSKDAVLCTTAIISGTITDA